MTVVAYRVVAVRVEPLGVETGLWCTRCARSSGVRAWVAVIFGDQMHLQCKARCVDCGAGRFLTEA